MHKASTVAIVLLFFVLIACDKVDVSKISDSDMKRIANNVIVCDPPYIRHASDCCLDNNNNSICDNDETPALADNTITENVVGQPAPTQTGPPPQQLAQEGPIAFTEYADYQEPFSGSVEPTLKQLKQQYGNKITLAYKNYLFESVHPNALNAAIAAECARDQGDVEFWAYHDKLFANQDKLDVANLKQFAADLGLDTAKFNTCLDTKQTEPRVRADIREAEARGVQGTPSFWVKDELVVGALPIEQFKQKIDEKLSGEPAAGAPTPQPAQPAPKVDVAEGTHTLDDGEPTPKIVIIQFTDYQSRFCRQFYTDTEQLLIDRYVKTGKIRFSVRNFPMSFEQYAQGAAEAAECAGAQGKFWEMHNTLFTKGNDQGIGLDTESLKQYARDLRLDTAKFDKCLDEGQQTSLVLQDSLDGQTAGISGVPSLIINGQLLVGAQPFAVLEQRIDAELATIN